MAYGSSRHGAAGWLVGLLLGLVLLIVELLLTMVIYTLLNLHANNTFGYLAGLSKWIGDLAFSWIFYLMPGLTNNAFASLVGDFSPKAILLLLIGLTVSALVRGISALIGRGFAGSEH